MASRQFGVTYVGATGDLVRRVWEHKNDVVPCFTRTYQCHDLVYFEDCDDMLGALQRERNIKHWVKTWKHALIEKSNPEWNDLYAMIAFG